LVLELEGESSAELVVLNLAFSVSCGCDALYPEKVDDVLHQLDLAGKYQINLNWDGFQS